MLQKKYQRNSDFILYICILFISAFVPNDEVMESFEKLLDTDFYKVKLSNAINFKENWIGHINQIRRKKPNFPINIAII